MIFLVFPSLSRAIEKPTELHFYLVKTVNENQSALRDSDPSLTRPVMIQLQNSVATSWAVSWSAAVK